VLCYSRDNIESKREKKDSVHSTNKLVL